MGRPAIFLSSCLPLFAAALATGGAQESDPIRRLQDDLATGRGLEFEPGQGYLRDLLERLKIDPSSQTLVFSKTSLQSDFISPKTPRALYFNEDTYVGWIPGAPLIEIMSVHPTRGVVFYTLANEKAGEKSFQTETKRCFRCHGGVAPSLFASSVFTAPSGYPRPFAPSPNATPDLPLRQRWGGWYVSGEHGTQRHMGNELALGTDEAYRIDVEKGANVRDLNRYFDPRPYLTPRSDIVALMVIEAQMDVQNALSATHAAFREESVVDACEPLVEALLCVGETKLTAPIKGDERFAAHYEKSAPKDRLGRSLSELDLRTRLLKYPCNPLIYSRSFEALPSRAKSQIWKRLEEVLSGRDSSRRFAHLSNLDRKAIFEILRDTKPEFALAVDRIGKL